MRINIDRLNGGKHLHGKADHRWPILDHEQTRHNGQDSEIWPGQSPRNKSANSIDLKVSCFVLTRFEKKTGLVSVDAWSSMGTAKGTESISIRDGVSLSNIDF